MFLQQQMERKKKRDSVEKLKKEVEKKDDEIAIIKKKAETEKAFEKLLKKKLKKMVNPEIGGPLLQVGVAYKHLRDKIPR